VGIGRSRGKRPDERREVPRAACFRQGRFESSAALLSALTNPQVAEGPSRSKEDLSSS
jgi:hypothetical protein